ncbi:MAG: mechanosensitive ion channel [Candidatus Promineifilaceae bacterium]|nr:mechanosensitive ion channel [Candidatus Promineifilaceae bacterium]
MKNRLFLIVLSPFILVILLASIAVGVISLNLETALVARQLNISMETARMAVLLWSCLAIPFKLLFIAIVFALAFIIHNNSWRLAATLINSKIIRGGIVEPSAVFASFTDDVDGTPRPVMRHEHRQTVLQLVSSIISLVAFSTAAVLSLAQFVGLSSLAVLVTVITGGLAWGARTLISDLLSGVSNIFEDNFDVGDKLEFSYAAKHFEGTVEKVTVRLAHLRAPTGELIIVPHGELRVLHNYSRGEFSATTATFLVKSSDLQGALAIVQEMADEAPDLLPNMIGPWRVLSREGELGAETEITLVAKAIHGRGATLRLRMMALVAGRLQQAGINLVE